MEKEKFILQIGERENDKEYRDLVEEKKRIKKLRKTLSWPLLRTACIPLGAKADCGECGEKRIDLKHIITHAGENRYIYDTILKLIGTKDSVTNLAGLEMEVLRSFWIYYKKNFKFMPKKKKGSR